MKIFTEEHKQHLRHPKSTTINMKRTLETKRKIGLAQKGKVVSEETKKKISLANKGHIVLESTKLKISEKLKNHLCFKNVERRRKISIANKGKKLSEETKIKIGFGNKGKIISEEVRNKISKKMKGRKNPMVDETKIKIGLANKGKKRTKEQKEKYSELQLKSYKNHPERIENYKQKRLTWIIPTKDTKPELLVQQLLIKNNIIFTKHKPLLNICQCDIFIEPNIAIFIDGCYWHGCEECFDKNKMSDWIKSRKIADILITQKLQSQGYIVLRFLEHEINKDINYVLFKIQENLQKIEGIL